MFRKVVTSAQVLQVKQCLFACIVLMAFHSQTSAGVALLLDTGTPTGEGGGPIGVNSTASYQTLAGAFETSQPHVVTSVEAYLEDFEEPGSLTFRITGRDGNLPDVGNTLFSANFDQAEDLSMGWYGPTGLNWSLPAGSYYLVLDPQPGFSTGMPQGAPHPTIVPFTNDSVSTGWSSPNTRSVGFRVTAIPEPSGFACLGLIGLVAGGRMWWKRRR